MTVIRTERWMTPALSTVRLQYMHADQVTAPPDGATLLGGTRHCPVAMFRSGLNLLGIEAHPEFPAAYARALIEDRRVRIGAQAADDALARVDEPTDARAIGEWIAHFCGA
jgi:GMP synthase-like glutamine amidotransferase